MSGVIRKGVLNTARETAVAPPRNRPGGSAARPASDTTPAGPRTPGEADAAFGAADWSASPLGPPETWHARLWDLARLILASRLPMFVAFGRELCLIHNEACALFLGATRAGAMARGLREVWSAHWAEVGPLVDGVLGGEAVVRENQPLDLGSEAPAWATLSFSPVHDESGASACSAPARTSRARRSPKRLFASPRSAVASAARSASGCATGRTPGR